MVKDNASLPMYLKKYAINLSVKLNVLKHQAIIVLQPISGF